MAPLRFKLRVGRNLAKESANEPTVDSSADLGVRAGVSGSVGMGRVEVSRLGSLHPGQDSGLAGPSRRRAGGVGALLALSTIGLFVLEGRGTPAVFDPPRKFVPHGPYRIVRNPMYVGGVAMLAGWALYTRSIAMLLYAAGAFVVIHTFVVRLEEPGLRKRFGTEYVEYCQAVPRWLPRFMSPHSPALL